MSRGDEATLGLFGELPIGPWRIADSPWPRTAGDHRNSRRADVEGPRQGRLRRVFEHRSGPTTWGNGGLAVASDGSLRMTRHGRLWALDPSGVRLWDLEPSPPAMSSPLLLADGICIVAAGQALLFVSAGGVQFGRVDTRLRLDDSGPALNLAPDGTLILTTILGELFGLRGSELVELGSDFFGYDLVPPAIDDDGCMVLAGYAGKGLVRVDPAGAIVWRSDLRYADLLPTVDREGRVAGGSLTEGQSRILARDGQVLGTWPAAATFAVADEGWVALSEQTLAGLGQHGELRWHREGGARGRWGSLGPAIDRRGRIHAPCGHSVVVLEPDGRERFLVPLPSEPSDLVLVADGRLALVLDDGLYFVE